MRGEINHSLMSGYVGVCEGSTEGVLYDLPYGYPAMIHGGDGRVLGELYEYDERAIDQVLRRLDLLEDCDPDDEKESLFVRRIVMVKTEDGRRVESWVYVASRRLRDKIASSGRRCRGGRWKKREQ